jgi:alanyl-tRNA synthetase
MKSEAIRKEFFEFFKSKSHKIVPSAPMVVKNDPTLMFTNAGMNQFKDIFLGNSNATYKRVANSQKCLRVSGKHNDLEEVGHDTYHHTMFEMLGNWSFGDYFKKEAIEWAWELLTDVYKIDKERLYVTVFGGDKTEGTAPDDEAYGFWKRILPEERILYGSKKDNFWEMGETGPCGPCSEIHIDLRDDNEIKKIPGKDLVNKDHPEVIEIWNLVFIEFNRLSSGKLVPLPQKHIDTGMGFERLTMVLQGVKSNYDTDIFQPLIKELGKISSTVYGKERDTDIALRVVSDHIRAVAFAIADGQLPSNTGAGYVIRRILRRAVRYGFTFLGLDEPFMYKLVPILSDMMKSVFPEIESQKNLIQQVVKEEEAAFLKTLATGIRLFEQFLEKNSKAKQIPGDFAFELFDTFGFPIDLTRLMAKEKGLEVDMKGFEKGLEQQKKRSRSAADKESGDWIEILPSDKTQFTGYGTLVEKEVHIVKYRKVVTKKRTIYELVLDKTPFYAESGGQVGDTGVLKSDSEILHITDTKKENNLWIHFCAEEPKNAGASYRAEVDGNRRKLIANNHSATHLMHAALRKVLGTHVEQKGSLVSPERLRFDFSHFAKMTKEEIREVEHIVNEKIRENIPASIDENVEMEEARKRGAMALFGEKYGNRVRVVTFDPQFSVELCGGTHVEATGQIGCFKIISESGIAAGVRRIEAITAVKAEEYLYEKVDLLENINGLFKNQKDLFKAVENVITENKNLQKEIEKFKNEKAEQLSNSLFHNSEKLANALFIAEVVELNVNDAKQLAHKLRKRSNNVFVVLATKSGNKVNLVVALSDQLVKNAKLDAGKIIREISKYIKGGGGGQPHLAMAGGADSNGISQAFDAARNIAGKI